MKLNELRIGTRLTGGFVLLLALLAAIVGIGLWQLTAVEHASHEALSLPLAKERLVASLYANNQGGVRRNIAVARSTDPGMEALFASDTKQVTANSNELMKQLEALPMNDEEKAALAALSAARLSYIKVRDQLFARKREGNLDEVDRLFKESFMPGLAAYNDRMKDLLALEQQQIDALSAGIQHRADAGRLAIAALGVAALLAGALMAWLLTRSIVGPLGHASRVADAVARGDLSQPLSAQGSDEVASLMHSLSAMTDQLRRMVSQVRDAAEGIRQASSEVAAGNQSLSERTEQAASNLQQTAASMEELTSTVQQSADSARHADALAHTAADVAVRGGGLVNQVVTTMDQISTSSRKISEIIGVIDGIAFQTNILALNAAVEAARAGEQGRGFAVVATEVRNLAQRSAQAAREIKGLIGDSVDRVESGSRLVADAGQTMAEIVRSVQQVSDVIGHITAAVNEQSSGITQVHSAVADLDGMTQHNAALVEQSAAASQSLRQQADTLGQLVSEFQLATH